MMMTLIQLGKQEQVEQYGSEQKPTQGGTCTKLEIRLWSSMTENGIRFWVFSAAAAAAAAKSLQSHLTLWDPIDGSLPGSTIPRILQARTLEWIAISFSNVWKWKVNMKPLSNVLLFTIPWTAAYQAPPPMRFSRQEYWNGVPLPSLEFSLENT